MGRAEAQKDVNMVVCATDGQRNTFETFYDTANIFMEAKLP